MKVEIDQKSGFCFGVKKAIKKAEQTIQNGEDLSCLGDIVHNQEEISRLSQMGMGTIKDDTKHDLKNKNILIRSHGAHPDVYKNLENKGARIIDATCPVVLKLQERVKKSYNLISEDDGQLVIYGKVAHPEVLGLNGQTDDNAIIVTTEDDLGQIDFSKPIEVYSQTTMPLDGFHNIVEAIQNKAKNKVIVHDTVCRQVANRVPHLKQFANKYEVILFVSGKKSSNGKLLFDVCKSQNTQSYFVSSIEEIENKWFYNVNTVGICGATSTPQWLMEKIKSHVEKL